MNCREFRHAFGADPKSASRELHEHRAQCAACDTYAQEVVRMDGLIKRALEIAAPAPKPIVKPAPPMRWYALAATIALAVGIGAIWFVAFPRDSLAKDVVAHLNHEPQALQVTDTRVANQLLDGVLRTKGLRLTQSLNDVSYARMCVVHRHFVPHLTVQTEHGPVTVLLLTQEKVSKSQPLNDDTYHGILMPTSYGALAVIGNDATTAASVADKLSAVIAPIN